MIAVDRVARTRSRRPGTNCVSGPIASCGWASSISRSSVVPERPTPTTNGAGASTRSSRCGSAAALLASEANSARPSAEPVSGSTACSGWGISPTTLPRSLLTPAMSATEPFGFWPGA